MSLYTLEEFNVWEKAREMYAEHRVNLYLEARDREIYVADWREMSTELRLEWWEKALAELAVIPDEAPTRPEPFTIRRRTLTMPGMGRS